MGLLSGGSKKQKSTQSMPSWQEAEAKKVVSEAGKLYGEGPVEYSERDLSAQNNQYLMYGADNLQGLDPGSGYSNYAQQGLDNLSDSDRYKPQFDQNAFNSVYDNPALQGTLDSFNRDVDRDTKQSVLQNNFSSGMSGNLGTSGDVGAALLEARGMDTKADFAASMYGNAFNQASNAGLSYGSQYAGNSLNADNSLFSGGLAGINTASDVYGRNVNTGLSLYGLDQSAIDREVNRDNYNANAPWTTLNMYKSAVGTMGDYGGTTKGKASGGGGGLLGGLGAASSAAGTGQKFGWWGQGAGGV